MAVSWQRTLLATSSRSIIVSMVTSLPLCWCRRSTLLRLPWPSSCAGRLMAHTCCSQALPGGFCPFGALLTCRRFQGGGKAYKRSLKPRRTCVQALKGTPLGPPRPPSVILRCAQDLSRWADPKLALRMTIHCRSWSLNFIIAHLRLHFVPLS
jgi:hypothetical protein